MGILPQSVVIGCEKLPSCCTENSRKYMKPIVAYGLQEARGRSHHAKVLPSAFNASMFNSI